MKINSDDSSVTIEFSSGRHIHLEKKKFNQIVNSKRIGLISEKIADDLMNHMPYTLFYKRLSEIQKREIKKELCDVWIAWKRMIFHSISHINIIRTKLPKLEIIAGKTEYYTYIFDDGNKIHIQPPDYEELEKELKMKLEINPNELIEIDREFTFTDEK